MNEVFSPECFSTESFLWRAPCSELTDDGRLPRQGREAWKKQQREKRKLMRGFAHKDEAPEAPQRHGQDGDVFQLPAVR